MTWFLFLFRLKLSGRIANFWLRGSAPKVLLSETKEKSSYAGGARVDSEVENSSTVREGSSLEDSVRRPKAVGFRLNGRSENLRLAQLANGAVLREIIVVDAGAAGRMKDQRKQGSPSNKRGNNATPSVPPTFGTDRYSLTYQGT